MAPRGGGQVGAGAARATRGGGQARTATSRVAGKLEQLQAEAVESKVTAVESKVTEAVARANKASVTALQVRLEALYNAKLLEDEELSTIEDTIADAIGMDDVDDGDQTARECVIQMIKLSEGIVSEKMFARQLKRKFV